MNQKIRIIIKTKIKEVILPVVEVAEAINLNALNVGLMMLNITKYQLKEIPEKR
jgi:hypothetical protein